MKDFSHLNNETKLAIDTFLKQAQRLGISNKELLKALKNTIDSQQED